MKIDQTGLLLKFVSILLLCVLAPRPAAAQDLDLPQVVAADDAALATAVPDLARKVIERYREDKRDKYLDNLFRLQLAASAPAEALATLKSLRDLRRATDPVSADGALIQFELYATAKLKQSAASLSFEDAYKQTFREVFGRLNDKAAYYVAYFLPDDLGRFRNDVQQSLNLRKTQQGLELPEALDFLRKYQVYQMHQAALPLLAALVAEDDDRRYTIQDDVLIKTPEGATLSAIIFRKKGTSQPGPAALFFNIYTDLARNGAKEAAAHGYVGVAADVRGKRLSPDALVPFEHDVKDTHAVIDWISKQPWSNGKVGMWGNSYTGFAQWAATKYPHPALKTIVPSAAAIPGLGLPMENNVFLNANYGWAFYVTNNKFLDTKVYADPERWSSLNERWYTSGRPYREIDRIDGTPNPWLQRWLAHPAYDKYWQDMVPYKSDYSKINIPVLTITGYYDDAQISALHFLKEHYKYNKHAEHYLLIGPYQHFSAQGPRKPLVVEGYAIDPVAQINTKEIIFQWMDYVMRGGKKPALLEDKINYQVMGANTWKHAPSLQKMSSEVLTLYLTDAPAGAHHVLARTKPATPGFLEQTVDLADRKTSTNDYYYPSPIITDKLELATGFSYISEPFAEPVSIDGFITGELKAIINKKDLDVSLVFYEVMPNGQLFHLSYFLGRASFAKDMSVRRLLTPGKVESIPFERSRMVSRQLSKGSRLLVVVNVNKNSYAQVNHGTGKDVSDESIADAKVPLKVRWRTDSYVKIPLTR